MKKIFSFLAAVLFAGSMMATTVTKTVADLATELSFTNSAVCTPFALDEVIAVSTEATDANTGKYYSNGEQIRLYQTGAAKLILTAADGYKISSVTLEYASQNTGILVEAASGEAVAFENVQSATFTVGNSGSATNGQARITSFSVTYAADGEGGETPVEPTMNYYVCGSMTNWAANAAYKLAANPAAEGEFMGQFTFAANDQFKVVYSDGTTIANENWFPGGVDNNYAIAEAGDYTVYFRPDGQGGEGWHEGYIYAVKKEAPAAISCADVYGLADNAELALNPVVVTCSNGANVWVKDATGSMLVYLPQNFNNEYVAGDILAGIQGTKATYKGLVEVKPTTDQMSAVTATHGEAPAPEELAVVSDADVNKYILIKGVSAEGAFTEGTASNINITLGNAAYVLRNNFKNGYTFEAGKTYDVVALVSYYNALQLYFVSATEVEDTPISGVETIYDWAGEIGTTIFGGNTNITTGTVKIHENTDDVNGIKFGSSYVYADGKYIAIKPAKGGFKAGDVLSVSVVFNNSDVTKYCMVDVYAADQTTRLFRSDSASTLNGRNAGEPVVQTYTLAADQDSLLLGRYGNTGMFVTLLKVERALVPPTPSINYYVAGSMGVWGPDEAYRLTPSSNGEYEGEFTFAANDEFKVIGYDGTTVTWFPEGMNNNYVITEAGDYKITFNPAGNVEGWYAGYYNVVKKEEPVVVPADPLTCAAAAELALAGNTEEKIIKGYVTEIVEAWSSFKNVSFWMADAVDGGQVFEAFRVNCETEAEAPIVGDLVWVKGNLTAYTNKNGVTIAETTKGGSFGIIEAVERPVVEPAVNLGAKTIAEFLELKNTKDTCILTGVVSNIVNTTYGNFDLTDKSGTVYVYGLLTPEGESKKFADLNVAEKDTLTVLAIYNEYNGNPQAKNAIFVEVKKAAVEPGETIELAFNDGGVDNYYYEQYRSTDIQLYNIPVVGGQLQGDGDFLQLEVYPADPNDISGEYSIEDEGLDDYYTYLMHIEGTDTTEIAFVAGSITVSVQNPDKETSSADLTVQGQLMTAEGDVYVINSTLNVYYNFVLTEEEKYQNDEAEADFNYNFDTYQLGALNEVVVGVMAQTDEAGIALAIILPQGQTELTAGTYEISDTPMYGTVMAGKNTEMGMSPSYAMTADQKLWFLVSGTVTLNEDGSIVVDALNSNGKAIKSTLNHLRGEGIDEVNAAAKATKSLKNGQLIIEKAGVKYNAQGAVIR